MRRRPPTNRPWPEDLAATSRKAYYASARALARWATGERIPPADLGPSALARYREAMIGQKTPSAVKDTLRGAVRFLRWCQAQGITV